MTVHLPRLRVEPLIGEAKQRMRRRRLLLAAVLAGVVALAAGLTLALRLGSFRGDSGAWLPQGVAEIDIRTPVTVNAGGIALRVTDPSKVDRITAWFNGLDRQPTSVKVHGHKLGCAGGYGGDVTFTFRAASGAALAKADSDGRTAWYCDPIQLTVGAQRASFLVDRNPTSSLVDPNPTHSLVGRVQHLLGVKIPPSSVYAG
jgi:hypothetical protein